jgi:DNA-binding HxlR family transcriptional regulator/putative sterol carrier protein
MRPGQGDRAQLPRRSYDQYCAVARALDVVGERWTLLVIRELLPGPKRYKDLLEGLPGIGTNLLAARLRDLEAAGAVQRRRLPAPAGAAVYELTDSGRELEPVVLDLARWGLKRMQQPRRRESFRPDWYGVAMRAAFRPHSAKGVSETYEFRIGADVFHLRVHDGSAEVGQGSAPSPDLTVKADFKNLDAVVTGQLSPVEAIETGRVEIQGDPAALQRCVEIFGLGELRARSLP